MGINWPATQSNLNQSGFAAGTVDGAPGRATYTAIISCAAQRVPDAAMRAVASELPRNIPKYSIDASPQRLAEFIAQTCHETGGYRSFEENLRYSAARLVAVWPSRFKTLADAAPYAWDPKDPDREDEALANKVYGGRMGNEANGTNDDDGWQHRGSGLLQHTGAAEYAALKASLGYEPDDVRDPAKSVAAACDYWKRRGVNAIVDSGDYTGSRKAVNGGTIGLVEVSIIRNRLLRVVV